MKRVYQKPETSEQCCEHCEEWPKPTRRDYLRGWVCKDCDCAMDAMDKEEVEANAEGGA